MAIRQAASPRYAPKRLVPTFCALLLFLSQSISQAWAAEKSESGANTSAAASFSKDLAPILAKKCLKCHGPEKTKGGYQLHTFELAMKAGESKEPSVVAGEPGKSELYRRLTAKDEDDRMPQKDDPLPSDQIALFERWIKEGARFDGPDPKAPLSSLIPRGPHPGPPAVYPRAVPVLALAFSPDGQELAVGGYHEITIWNPAEGKLLRRIKNVAQRTHDLAYSPDGLLLAAAGGAPGQDGEVTLFDPTQAAPVRVLGTAPDTLLAVCFSPDGKRLAAGGTDNTIRLYDVADGKEQWAIQQHADWVMALAFNQDGSRLASASRDRTARVYNAKTGELELTFNEHNAPVFAIAFSADGKQIFSAGRDKKIFVWKAEDGKKVGEISGLEDDITKLLVQGNLLFSASADKSVRQYDAANRDLVRAYSGHEDWVYGLAGHAATKRLASGSHDGQVRIWNTEAGKMVTAFIAAPGYDESAARKQ